MDKCLICGQAGELLYHGLRDYIVASNASWSLRYCPRDRIAWISPVPSAQDLEKAYSSYHTHMAQAESLRLSKGILDSVLAGYFGYSDDRTTGPRRRMGRVLGLIPIIREIVGTKVLWLRPSDGPRLLDVGCGSGRYLAFMRSLGWTVQGIEPDEQAASCARQNFGLPVKTGLIEESDFPDAAFDAVTVSHVIEHVSRPGTFLAACFRKLRPGGKLVITTPNFESLGHRVFRRHWSILEPPRHLHIFSPASLGAYVEGAGFRAVRVFTASRGARVMWDMSRALLNTGSPGEGPDKYRHPWHIGGILFYFFEQTINAALRSRGEEIILIACKPGPSPRP